MLGRNNVIIDVRPEQAADSDRFWSAALGWPLGDPWPEHHEFSSFEPSDGAPYVHRQIGDHGPRLHLDFEVESVDIARHGQELTSLGASLGELYADWQVMASPGGMPFCLLRPTAWTPPAARSWPAGHRSRLVQVCIDSPARWHDSEVSFWRAATGWRWVPSDGSEFAGKVYPPDPSQMQLLLQRLDETDPRSATDAHIDVGTDDVEAEVTRLVDLGAVRGETGRGWVVLTDPVGMTFCVTGNDPT